MKASRRVLIQLREKYLGKCVKSVHNDVVYLGRVVDIATDGYGEVRLSIANTEIQTIKEVNGSNPLFEWMLYQDSWDNLRIVDEPKVVT